MFRNPREDSHIDLGRPPTPPSSGNGPRRPGSVQGPMANAVVERPLRGATRQAMKSSPARSKPSKNGNASILSFFKKAEPAKEPVHDSLFLSDEEGENSTQERARSVATTGPADGAGEDRFNEASKAFKRRKTGVSELSVEGNIQAPLTAVAEEPPGQAVAVDGRKLSNLDYAKRPALQEKDNEQQQPRIDGRPDKGGDQIADTVATAAEPPAFVRETTSVFNDGFEGIEDFAEDEFPEDGEEYMERRWMEEQRMLELEFEQDDEAPEAAECEPEPGERPDRQMQQSVEACPICSASLQDLDANKASEHVNDCLDGMTTQVLPQNEEKSGESSTRGNDAVAATPTYKRFQRAAIARPGQESPFSLDNTVTGGTAFSKIMASHAEDSAWATAAANELAARGKPAYKRTCPFYKILPGFFICVDAFRYGAVEGCHAYFLSHFHSDHYVGLTSSWCHGPIYCSRVTGNLVRQQLRVDAKWVVDLEWDTKVEVPRTDGVYVTMIPANHCPGSSLYLFEKSIGRGAKPKVQRVLHCGDFRACPAHVQHPLLRPDVIDKATGKKREQKLDVCYLDTTYLTPKYAFPRQEDVIKACADMCVSLSKERVDESDGWEQMKKQRAGAGMTRFVQKGDSSAETPNSSTGVSSNNNSESVPDKKRGRLLVVVGTYSIGKERICIGIAKALGSKIFAAPGKQRICAALEDAELSGLLTNDPLAAQVHMQMLMEIRAETLADYLAGYQAHFSRVVGFRPSGWTYRPPSSRSVESPLVQTVLHSDRWKPAYSMADLTPQRGSSRHASCFGVPYSEHSSFRELTMFCCALRIDKIIPTVNVGSAKSRDRMMAWIDRWAADRKKNGLYAVADDAVAW